MDQLGKDLKQRREELGYSIDEIAKITSLSTKNIRQLEEGNLAAFKDELTYVPYYLKNYCKILDIDYMTLRRKLDDSILSYTEAIKLSKVKEHKQLEENIKKSVTQTKKRRNVSTNSISFFVVIVLIFILVVYGIYHLAIRKNRGQQTPPPVVTQQKDKKPVEKTVDKKEDVKIVSSVEIQKMSDTEYQVILKEKKVFELVLNNDSWLSFRGSSIQTQYQDNVYKKGTILKVDVNAKDKLVIRVGVLENNFFKIDEQKIEFNQLKDHLNPKTFVIHFKGV